MTITTTSQPNTRDLLHAPSFRRRRPRAAVWLSIAAVVLGIGGAAVYAGDDGTPDEVRSEWTSEDGLRWEHPDGRSYVVASPQSIGGR